MSVTSNPKAPYHSMYLGAPISAPSSMKSKSRTRFKAAITTTKPLKSIPMLLLLEIIPMPDPKKLMIKLIRYRMAMPPVAAAIPNLKFSVAAIKPDLYAVTKLPKFQR